MPDPQHAPSPGVAEAIRSHLVHRHRGIVGPSLSEACLHRLSHHERPESTEGSDVERQFDGDGGRIGEGTRERPAQGLNAEVVVAGARPAVPTDEGVAAARFVDDVPVERRRVVGTHQSEAAAPGEGDVQQRLMALALDELGRAAFRPDRFPDPPQGTVPVLAYEVAPCRDDASRVRSHICHVGEEHLTGISLEPLPKKVDLSRADDDEHGLGRPYRIVEEGRGSGDELSLPGVEERLVAEPVVGLHGRGQH
jgi:hypothetical protein